jgi:hypothetical protein
MSKRTRPDKYVGSESLDSETPECPPRKRSGVSGKSQGKGKSSIGSARRKRETYTEAQKEYLAEQHGILKDWELVGKAFRDEFPSKGYVTDQMLQWVLQHRRAKQATQVEEDPELTSGGRKYSRAEHEFLVDKRSKGVHWQTITESFGVECKDNAERTKHQLRDVFRALRIGGPHIPEDLHRRAAACEKERLEGSHTKVMAPKLLAELLEEVDRDNVRDSYSKAEKAFILNKRAVGNSWRTVTQLFCDEFSGRSSVTWVNINKVFQRLQRRRDKRVGYTNSSKKQKQAPKVYSASEKNWLVEEHEKGESWDQIAKSFRDKSATHANVTPGQLAMVYFRLQQTRGNTERPETRLLKRAQLDLTVLRIYRDYPDENHTDLAEKI